jgi:glycosyltransferase involved in cell wall biosynthesis
VRVAVVSAWEPWRLGDGAAFVLAHQLQVLAQRHEITVLAAGARATTATPPVDARRLLPGVELQWFGTDRGSAADFAGRWWWSIRRGEPAHVSYVERPALLAAYDRAVASADVVHLHGWGTARLGARAGGVPAVHMAIDPWAVNFRNRRLSLARRVADSGQHRRVVAHEQRWYPGLAAVVVVTENDAATVRELAPGAPVAVVPNGVDAGPPPTPIPDGVPVIGFHGVFDSQANVDAARSLVTQILPQVRRELPDTRVLLVGRRPPLSVRQLVGRGVELRADVADVRCELDRMTVHVDWMTSGAGIKNKVLEAMAAGRPVVTSASGAAGIGAGPGVIIASDATAAAGEIVRLLSDPVAAAALGAGGRERVTTEFSWETTAAALESVWQRAVEVANR